MDTLTDPTITCPNCGTAIKLTESLAAPRIASTRQSFEKKIAEKHAEVAKRESAIKDQQAVIGWGQEEDRQKSRNSGFDGHLVKPVDDAVLTKLLAGLSEAARSDGGPKRIEVAT